MKIATYCITPVAKPRMTRRDKWLSPARPCVAKYREYKQALYDLGMEITPDDGLIFIMPMPKSWNKKKKAQHHGQPHDKRPDLDNLVKGIYDALLAEDSHMWRIYAEKRWGYEGKILVLRGFTKSIVAI